MIYTLTLNPALDYDIYLDNLNTGELNISKQVKFRAGGKGINVSIMLKNLGLDSIALGYLGGFTSFFIIQTLNDKNISHNFFEVNETTRINVKINDKNKETEITGKSITIQEKDIDKLINYIKNFSKDDILVLSGSIPYGLDNSIYKELSKNTQAKVILDTRGDNLLSNIYNNFLLKPNIKEIEQAFNQKIENEKQLISLAKKILDMNVENILISMGENGAILITKDSVLKANVPKGIYINSIGAGDSMIAGFIYAKNNNYTLVDTLKLAVACGSATTYSYDIAENKKVRELFDKIIIKTI